MKRQEPNPGDPTPEITFLDYLRNCRLGRAFARTFGGPDAKKPEGVGRNQDVEGGSVGFLGRDGKADGGGGLGSLLRGAGKLTGRTKAPTDLPSQKSEPLGKAMPAGGPELREPVPTVTLESVGAVLKRAREGYDEDLSAVAQTLHIRLAYLQAIEDQRFERLPGPAYAVGFIRAYSDYLGLDSAEMVRRFKIEVEGLDKRQELFFPVPVSESKVPGGAVIMVSLLLVAVAYGAWFYLTSDGRPVAEAVPPVPEELGGPPAEEQVASAAMQAEPSEESEPAEAAEEAEVSEEAEAGDVAVPAENAEPVEPVASAEAATSELASAPSEEATESAAEAEVEQGSSAGEAISAAIARSVDPAAEGTVAEVLEAAAERSGNPEALSGSEGERQARLAGSTSAPRPGSEEAANQQNALTLARILKRPADLIAPQAPQPQSAASSAIPSTAGAGRGAARQPLPGSPGIVVPESEGGSIPSAPATEQLAARTEGRTPQVFGAENDAARIVLRATQDSWVQVRDGNDNLVMTRVLRRGDEYRVPDQNGLTLLTGNAGGIEIVVDGAALSPLGPVGAVRRNIQLDPERLLEGTAIPPR